MGKNAMDVEGKVVANLSGSPIGTTDSGTGDNTSVGSTPKSKDQTVVTETPEKAQISQDQGEESSEGQVGESVDDSSATSAQQVPYHRFKQVNDELKQIRNELESFKEQSMQGMQVSAADVDPVKEEARKVLSEMGFKPEQDILKQVDSLVERRLQQEKLVERFEVLGKKYNGTDGKPKFDFNEVADFMERTGVLDPEIAYEILYKDALVDAKVKDKRSTAYTEKSGSPVRQAGDDSAALMAEAKKTGDWSKVISSRIKFPKRG